MTVLNKLSTIFSREAKIKLLFLLMGIIFLALLEIFTLALISPVIAVIMDRYTVYTDPMIHWIYQLVGFADPDAFLMMIALLLGLVYLLKGVFISVLNTLKFRFIAKCQTSLSENLLSKILNFSYLYHTKHNIADIQRIIIRDVEEFFLLVIATLGLAAELSISLFIILFLLVVSPVMTFAVIGLAVICILIYPKSFRLKMKMVGQKYRSSHVTMTKSVNQALGGIKEVKIANRARYFSQVFQTESSVFVKSFARYHSINAMPRVIIETICFGGAFLLLGLAVFSGIKISYMVPQMGLFVVASFRLLPNISRMVNQLNSILFYRPAVDAVYRSLHEEDNNTLLIPENQLAADSADHPHDIMVQSLSFNYPEQAELVLRHVSLVIPENYSVAFTGSSGAGKTTLIDLILGVLIPSQGAIYYNGKSIHHHFDYWSRHVGYIPQQIYLLDETIRENVAFGVEKEAIDDEKIWQALEKAQLKSFVKGLEQGLDTVVGDRGVRLSGGQRQRIGIARALYEDPPILFLDEATSALDDETESAVMAAIMDFKGNKTIIIIAHRLSTIEHCDIVYKVENKTIIKERG